jgi:hypothetical protein
MKLLETIQEGIYITRQDNMGEVFWTVAQGKPTNSDLRSRQHLVGVAISAET